MTITNERLREMSINPYPGISATECKPMAAELLAAREVQRKFDEVDPVGTLRAAIARAEKAEAERDYFAAYEVDLTCIRKVLDQIDAPHDPEDGVSLEPKRIRLLAEQRDAARAEVERLKKDQEDWRKGVDYIRGPLVKFAKKNLPTLSCVDIGRAVLEVCAEVERLRAELDLARDVAKHQRKLRDDQLSDWVDALGNAIGPGLSPMQATIDLRAYRDRTEAALVELSADCWEDHLQVWDVMQRLGLDRRDAKGEAK